MSEERIFRDKESLTPDAIAAVFLSAAIASLTPDAIAADRKTASLTELPPFVYALGAVLSRLNNGIN